MHESEGVCSYKASAYQRHPTFFNAQHHMDSAIGVHIIDRWTYYALEFLEKVTSSSRATLRDFVSPDYYYCPLSFQQLSHSLANLSLCSLVILILGRSSLTLK